MIKTGPDKTKKNYFIYQISDEFKTTKLKAKKIYLKKDKQSPIARQEYSTG